MIKIGDNVRHEKFGKGVVISLGNNSVIVRFEDDGLQECPINEVRKIISMEEEIKCANNYNADEVLAKVQGTLIQGINNKWGVFSKSAIDLLPHQLWVCHQVQKKWPIRYLVADDVGLGKTIEAGLIIGSLIASKKVNRVLILTPAPLTIQWHERLNDFFDLKFDIYNVENEQSKVNYWKGHNRVIASFPTLQINNHHRQEKLLESDSWDLVIVDEAHHMNAQKQQGETLEYQLFKKLEENGKIISTVFFTGTPHRGVDYSFWALMKLLDSEKFDPKFPSEKQYKYLPEYFIRNNKANTIDINGHKLFQPIKQHPETFSYYPEESEFYNQMSKFILEGKTYANSLSGRQCISVQLVLTALQKLASSSIAAVTSALETRRNTLRNIQNNDDDAISDYTQSFVYESDEEMPEVEKNKFILMENEIKNLGTIIDLGNSITHESRIDRIIQIIKETYPEENILFFTEYKKTQALLIKELMKNFGEDCVTFINGDGKLNKVEYPDGSIRPMQINRNNAAELFNYGQKRYLVSTEAAGEGIDLQENCHVLIHVDLPWNPMRLHQRVGRINRYGQRKSVDVISLRNPDTVEAHIWDILENKLENIKKAFTVGMDDPEDMLQLVLGMNSGSYYANIFSEGSNIKKENLKDWFDEKTKTFGGKSAISTVNNIVGNSSKFNVSGLPDVPKSDLPDLIPFFKRVFKQNGKRVNFNQDTYSVSTPENWMKGVYGVQGRYEGLVFRRKLNKGEKHENICGVGHFIFDKCLEYSDTIIPSAACISGTKSYFIYRLYDRKTYSQDRITKDFVVISYDSKSKACNELAIDKALKTINEISIGNQEEKHLDYIPNEVKLLVQKKLKNSCFTLPDSELQLALCGSIL